MKRSNNNDAKLRAIKENYAIKFLFKVAKEVEYDEMMAIIAAFSVASRAWKSTDTEAFGENIKRIIVEVADGVGAVYNL